MSDKSEKIKNDLKTTAVICLQVLPDVLTPEIVSDPKIVMVKIAQKIGSFFLSKFAIEYNNRLRKGEIKNENFKTEKPILLFNDLLKIIDEGNLEEERFQAMKSIFFSSIAKNATEDEELLAYQFMQTCKQLSSAEILILRANYQVIQNTDEKLTAGVDLSSRRGVYWAKIISEKIGHNIPELVFQYEDHLIDLKLITNYQFIRDKNEIRENFNPSPYFRLTSLGYKLCEFITKYK